ncbi:MAG: DUF4446 family protein [Candidatus Microgenomates bacterium]
MINLTNIIFFIWLFILSFYFFKLKNHYNNLISKTKKESLDQILDLLLSKGEKVEKEIDLIKNELNKQIELSKYHYQKLGLIRYNPFDRTGGKQSFVIALLDKENSGLILNFIYTKEGLRVYTKKVFKGNGEEYGLSDEEKQAIEKSK